MASGHSVPSEVSLRAQCGRPQRRRDALVRRVIQERLSDCRCRGCAPARPDAALGSSTRFGRCGPAVRSAGGAGEPALAAIAVLVGMPGWTPFARRDSPVAGAVRSWRSCLPSRPVYIPVLPSRAPKPLIAKPPSVTAPKGPFAILLSTARIAPLKEKQPVSSYRRGRLYRWARANRRWRFYRLTTAATYG